MYTKLPETKIRNLKEIEKPAVSITVLIFSINKGKLEIVLVKRVRDPFLGLLSIPGDIISIDDDLEAAARKILKDKTGIHDVYLEQLYTFGNVNRDPRGRVISIAYFAFLPHNSVDLSLAPDSLHASFIPIEDLPKLAFDHNEIVNYGVERIKGKIEYSNIAQGLLPEKFRLSELQAVYEIILGKKLDKRNFRKKMNAVNLLESTNELYREGSHRPATLYKFKSKDLVMFN